MNTQNLSTLKINKLTQAQYDRELAAGRIDENALYLTPDDNYSNEDIDAILATKANSSHNHAASNITSGTLSSDRLPTVPIAKGGTGATTAAAALTNLGLTATAAELNKMDGVTATTAELNYVDGVTSNIQTQLDSKVNKTGDTMTGDLTIKANFGSIRFDDADGKKMSVLQANNDSHTTSIYAYPTDKSTYYEKYDLPTPDTGRTSNKSYKILTTKDVTATVAELNYVDGVTSNIQTQLNGKAASSHNHTGLAAVTTAGTGAAYTATVDGITSLTKGANFIMIPHTTSTSIAPTLNVNGLGAKTIQRLTSSNDYSADGYNAGWLQSTRPVHVIYSGSYWYVQSMSRPAAYDLRGTVSIANGGTGADTVSAARTNLGIVNSDWNVNDETNPAFIKNRPFYGDGEELIFTITPDEFVAGTQCYMENSVVPGTITELPESVNVYFEGKTYSNITGTMTQSDPEQKEYEQKDENGNWLFTVQITYAYAGSYAYHMTCAYKYEGNTGTKQPTENVKLSFTNGEIKKIDPKYLPDNIGGSTIYDNTTKTNLYLKTDGFDSTLTSDDVKGSIQGLPIGSIIEWSSLTPPNNYLICDGSWVSQAVYADLYAVIGHTYDGNTSVEGSFRLPNRCGKVGVGYDADNTNFNALGKTGGEETHTLTIAEMPTHSHNNARGVKAASPGSKDAIDTSWATGSAFASNVITNNTGGGNAHNNLQPYETTIFVIKYKDGNMFSDEYGGVVIDNLNSTSTKDVLSAYQGKVLNDTKLDKSGGTIDGNLTVNGDYLYYGTAGYVGSNGTTSLHIQGTASNYISVKTKNGKGITISGTDGVYPSDTDTLQLGAGNKRWNVIYCKSGSVSTSDRTHKENIVDIDNKYIQLFDKLKPVTFEYNYETSDRTHVGFISQDVKESMDEIGLTDLEFAGYCRDEKKLWNDEEMCWEPVLDEEGNPTYIYSLRYSEFIALNTKMIQLNKAKIAEQEAEIDTLKSELSELKTLLNKLMDSKEE